MYKKNYSFFIAQNLINFLDALASDKLYTQFLRQKRTFLTCKDGIETYIIPLWHLDFHAFYLLLLQLFL